MRYRFHLGKVVTFAACILSSALFSSAFVKPAINPYSVVAAAEDESPAPGTVEGIKELMTKVPGFFGKYCTQASAATLQEVVTKIKSTNLSSLSSSQLTSLYHELEQALDGLVYVKGEVPRVYVSTLDGKGNSLKKADGNVDALFSIVDTDGETISETDGSLKVHGNSTAAAEKKPYNLKFDHKTDVLGMGAAKKWVLLANCFDPTLMRNSIGFEFARKMGMSYTSNQCYVELWIDGLFKGCYVLVEPVESGDSRVQIDSDNNEFLMQYEHDRVDPDSTYITTTNGNLRFELKDPDEPTSSQKTFAAKKTNLLVDALLSKNYSNVLKYIDEDSFVKYYVLNEFLKTRDIRFSSAFFYYKGGKFYAGPAWDYDLSSGNCNPNYYAKYFEQGESYQGAWANVAPFYRYLTRYSEFNDKVKSTFKKYSTYMKNLYQSGGWIDQTSAKYKNVFARNFDEAGWDVSKAYSWKVQLPPMATYQANVNYLKTWLSNRYSWMENYLAKNCDDHTNYWTKAEVPATCTTSGRQAYRICNICGKLFDSKRVEKKLADFNIPALGHNWDAGKVTQFATAVACGERKHECTRCHIYKIVELAKVPITNGNYFIATATSAGSTSVKFSWNSVKGAAKYVVQVYATPSTPDSKTGNLIKSKTVTGTSCSVTGLKTKTYYRFLIQACSSAGNTLKTSNEIYETTVSSGYAYSNPSRVGTSASAVTVRVGQSKILNSHVALPSGKKLREFAVIQLISANPSIIQVTGDGKLLGMKPGACTVYAVAQNGVKKAVTVTCIK